MNNQLITLSENYNHNLGDNLVIKDSYGFSRLLKYKGNNTYKVIEPRFEVLSDFIRAYLSMKLKKEYS